MIFFYNANGTLIKTTYDHVYQGSDGATTLYFVAPVLPSATIGVAFNLPNGERSTMHTLMPVQGDELQGIVDGDGNTYAIWSYDLDGYLTAYAGTLTAQFFITLNGITRSTQAATFTVEDGVPPVQFPPETWADILANFQAIYEELNTKQDVIDEEHPLPSDYVSDAEQEHKFVSATEKATWNNKVSEIPTQADRQVYAQKSQLEGGGVEGIILGQYGGDGYPEAGTKRVPMYSDGRLSCQDPVYNHNTVNKQSMEAFALPITTKYGANLTLSFNSANGVLTAQLKDQDGNNLGQAQTVTIDLTSLEAAINSILALIPAQASALNQLADKAFVNSSISTNTAHFIGTFNSLAELEAYSGTITNNDYANVIRTESGQTYYDRYTYNEETEEWEFNFTINTTTFTAAQWAAINSGITADKVADIDNIKAVIPSAASSSNKLVDYNQASQILGLMYNLAMAELNSGLSTKADKSALDGKINTSTMNAEFFNSLY